jgi:hypothetical protein
MGPVWDPSPFLEAGWAFPGRNNTNGMPVAYQRTLKDVLQPTSVHKDKVAMRPLKQILFGLLLLLIGLMQVHERPTAGYFVLVSGGLLVVDGLSHLLS